MKDALLNLSERWFRLLLRLYPADFRDEMGASVVETYRDRARDALKRGGIIRLAALWLVALADFLRNGPGERAHPAASWRRSGNWGRDLELATRRLVRSPTLTAAVVGTLSVGLGTFAVVYAVVDKVLIEPMPYRSPDDLYFVWRDYGPIFDLNRGWVSGPDVVELQQAGGVIESAVGLRRDLVTFSQNDSTDPMQIAVMATTPNLFEVLGVQPALGRGFAMSEVGSKRTAVIVLTHELWNRLGASPEMVGSTVRLNGQPYTVIGVLPRSFAFMRHSSLGAPQRADAYTTFDTNLVEGNPRGGSYAGLIRVRRGTSPQAAAAAVDVVGRVIDARVFDGKGLKLYPLGLKSDLVARVRPALLVLGFASAFLVLVLMVNLGSVLLARAAQREHEFAVSRALGANNVALVRATLFEGGLLGCIGGSIGALAAVWGTRALLSLAPLDLPRREAIAVDWGVGAVVVGTGTALGLLAAIAPAAWAARTSLASLLAMSAVRGGGGHGRMRRGMVVAQVALSLVLLSTGGLVVRSFERLLVADPGFKAEGLLTVRVPVISQFFPNAPDVLAAQQRIEDAFTAIPGVIGVSAATSLPLTASANQNTLTIPAAPGITGDAARDNPLVDYIGIRASYVEVMGMRIIAGRTFERARRDGAREVLIDSLLAKQFFPTGSPLGAKIPAGQNNTPMTIVGVVDQARLYDVHQDGRPQLYFRAEDNGSRSLAFVLRTARDPHAIAPDVRAAVRRVDPRLALAELRTMDEIVDDALRQQRISAVLTAGFALGGLLLAAMGLFGVVSSAVTRRHHEFGVRLALGADHGNVLRLVLREGAMLVTIGLLIGVPGVYLAGGFIKGVLVGVSPLDPTTLLAVACGLALVAMIACYLPARRVLRIEPAQSLRE